MATEEIREVKVEVHKVLGIGNPADLMTKVLTVGEDRLRGMSLRMVFSNGAKQMAEVEGGTCELFQFFSMEDC